MNSLQINYSKDKKYIVAVSGGPDSMALLNILFSQKLKIVVCHVNYHTREASNYEEKMVKEYCSRHQIPCFALDTSTYKVKGNFEAWARKVRYDFFEQIYCSEQCEGLFVAHHLDDLIETYLMQKKRKGIVKYYGISPLSIVNNMKVLRPLLSVRKKELEEYCDENGIPYSIDITNLTNEHTRNIIRHEIVEKLTEDDVKVILQEIEDKNKILNEVKNQVDLLINRNDLTLNELLSLDNLTFNMYFYEYITRRYPNLSSSLGFTKIFEIKKALKSEKANAIISLKEPYYFVKEYNSFKIIRKEENTFEYIMDHPMEMDTKEFYCDFRCDTSSLKIYESSYPLTIRNAKMDDVVKFGKIHKKVNRILIDEKIPISLRNKYPIVLDKDNKVVYIPLYNSLSQKNIANNLKFVIK